TAFTVAQGASLASCPGCISYLATLTSLAENQFVANNFADFGFFGLYQPGIFVSGGVGTELEPGTPAQGAPGQWTWASGEPFYDATGNVIFSNWGGVEPNNGAGGENEDAAEWGSENANGVAWNDIFNSTVQGYLVEFEPRVDGRVPEP